jgi:hypothetical protein
MKKYLYPILSVLISISGFLFISSPVKAYSGSQAKAYADTWANSNNSSYHTYPEDCTNFVSQALFNGGYSMVFGNYSTTNDNNWFHDFANGEDSNSWAVANSLVNFQRMHSPGGYWGSSYSGAIGNNQYNDASIGDVITYEWTSSGWIDHTALEVGTGSDPNSGWYGDLVDAHTSNRYHGYWTLQPYNSQAYTTRVSTLHISSSN